MATSEKKIDEILDKNAEKKLREEAYWNKLKDEFSKSSYIRHEELLNLIGELALPREELAKAKKIKMGERTFAIHPYTGKWVLHENQDNALKEETDEQDQLRITLLKKAAQSETVLAAQENLEKAQKTLLRANAALLKDSDNEALIIGTENAQNIFDQAKLAFETERDRIFEKLVNEETRKKVDVIAAKQMRETLMGNPRNALDWAANDLQERILKVQIYNHVEKLIAFRMAAPVSLPGMLMFVIEASVGDIDFKNQDVQTTLAIGFLATIGVLGAAYFIKSKLHRKWYCDVNIALEEYKDELDKYMSENIGEDERAIVSGKLVPLMEVNLKYAQHNWYPHEDTPELNDVGFRRAALNGDTGDSEALAKHKNRRSVSLMWIVLLNMAALASGVILAGMAHEKRSFLHKLLNKRPGEPHPPKDEDSGDFFSQVFGYEPAFYAVASILLVGVIMSAIWGVKEYNKATQNPVLTGKDGDGTLKGFGRLKLSPLAT